MHEKESVVIYPGLGMGHLIPAVELAKLFVSQEFHVIIILIELPLGTSSASDSIISRVSAAYPSSISFHRLPKVTVSPDAKDPGKVMFETLRLSNRPLLEFLRHRKSISNVKALVLDMFCTDAFEVATELGLPSYIFFASSASSLVAFTYSPTIKSQLWDGNLKEQGDSPVHFPGLPPMTASDLPLQLLERNDANEALFNIFERFPQAKGIAINTFECLEERAVKALVDGLCVPGRTMPPVYCIGPLISNDGGNGERHECLAWLDEQPEKSVVFLCFGSMGSFSVEQLKEMANGLEMSGQRFLWVVRSPPSGDPADKFGPKPEPDLEVLLPEGFLKRTERQGMVVKSWAPQTAVLDHPSIGAFVSHCGWNSTLEVVTAGVPIIAWPLYAEQRMNKVYLLDAGIAVAMEGYDKGLVTAEEIERKVKLVMESEIGKVLKEQAVAMKERALAAGKEDGSSTAAWKELVAALRNNGSGQALHQ